MSHARQAFVDLSLTLTSCFFLSLALSAAAVVGTKPQKNPGKMCVCWFKGTPPPCHFITLLHVLKSFSSSRFFL